MLALVLGGAALVPTPAVAAEAQKQPKPAVVRIAEGKVVNGASQPVEGAVVYLENPTSMAIKSYLTDKQGQFHFSQLEPQTDYDVWAEHDGHDSKHKFISQFSSHNRFDFTLKIDPAHKAKLLGIF